MQYLSEQSEQKENIRYSNFTCQMFSQVDFQEFPSHLVSANNLNCLQS